MDFGKKKQCTLSGTPFTENLQVREKFHGIDFQNTCKYKFW